MPTPKKLPFLVSLRGDERYARYLDRLITLAAKRGVRIETRHQLAEYALTVLGLGWGEKSPPRSRPVGTNQHGTPKTDLTPNPGRTDR